MYRIFPAGEARPVDDAELVELYRSPDRPCLRVNFVTSVDGAVEVEGRSAGLGNPADHEVFGLLRMFPHALMVGAGTLRQERYHAVRLDEPRRAWRREHGLAAYPRLVVVSSQLNLDPAHPALADAPTRPVIITHVMAPPARMKALGEVADVLVHGTGEVDLPRAMAELRSRGMTQILCEGGPHLFGSLTSADLVDEVCLTVSPLLTGAGAGRITAGPASALRGLTLAHALVDDGALLLRYAREA